MRGFGEPDQRIQLADRDALERVRRGITTLKEINKVTFIEASR